MRLLSTQRPSGAAIEPLLWYGYGKLAISPDGTTLAATFGPWGATGGQGRVVLWDISQPSAPRELEQLVGKECVAFAPDGTLVYGDNDPLLQVHGRAAVRLDSLPGREWYENVRRVAIAPSGRIAVGMDRSLAIIDGTTITPLPRKHQASITWIGWSGERLYSVDASYLRVWDVDKRAPLKRIPFESQGVALAPDGSGLLVAGKGVIFHPFDKRGLVGAGKKRCRGDFATLAAHGPWIAASSRKELVLFSNDVEHDRVTFEDQSEHAIAAFHPSAKILATLRCATLSLYAID